ncbi:MAG: CBS domain-containing protein [Burkholderiales bacterium]
MKARDIMTSPVTTVGPDTPVQEIAALLYKLHISGVPVLERGRLVGLVSEGDLLHRHEIGTDRPGRAGSWWLRLFSGDRSPAEYVKSHAQRARDIMTREVITVAPDMPVAEIATLLETRGVKRVPVLRGEKVVGIVSRANLVQALAASRQTANRATQPSDQAIRGRLLAELERQPWWGQVTSNVIVAAGVVHYFGMVDSADERAAARAAAESLPGVRGVEDHRFSYADIPSAP